MLILNEEQIEQFKKITGVNANKIFISKNGKYYYAILLEVEREVKVRISKEIAHVFI